MAGLIAASALDRVSFAKKVLHYCVEYNTMLLVCIIFYLYRVSSRLIAEYPATNLHLIE